AFDRDVLAPSVARGQLQSIIQFDAPFPVGREEGATFDLHAAIINAEHFVLGAEFGIEIGVEFSSAPHLQCLGNHDRPGENRKDYQDDDDHLGLSGSVLPYHQQIVVGCCKKVNRYVHQQSLRQKLFAEDDLTS